MPLHEDRPAAKAAQLKKDFERQRELWIEDGIKLALDDRRGRQMLWWMLGIAGVGGLPKGSDAQDTYFRLGELNVGQQLLDKIIQLNPQAYLIMQQENYNDRAEYERRALELQPQSGTDFLGTGEYTQHGTGADSSDTQY